jgi:hypothetical protein
MRATIAILFFSLLIVKNLAAQEMVYQPGEKVEYLIQYGFINGGLATLELKKDTCCGLKTTYHTRLTGATTGLADAIFQVRDVYECYMDPVSKLPIKSIRDISEGRYKKYNVVMFDRETRSDSAVLNSDLTGQHVVQYDIHDILSCFYWFRNNILPYQIDNMKIGDTVTINTWFTDEFFPIIMIYYGTEEIKTKAGKINCYKFGPVCEIGRLFRSKEAISFWFSADANYLPVKIRFEIIVGAFEVNMTNYEGLKYPLDIRNK